jgi:hypothetical protein
VNHFGVSRPGKAIQLVRKESPALSVGGHPLT